MITNKDIILIQNTNYHFETLISLYTIFQKLNINIYIYICQNVKHNSKFNQIEFLNNINANIIDIDHPILTKKQLKGIIISVYPNPYVSSHDAIPNYDDAIFKKLNSNQIVYISHRFKNIDDYASIINASNSICLSPLSKKIGIDYLHLTDMPMLPSISFDEKEQNIKLTIQGHFELNGKDLILFRNIIYNLSQLNNKLIILNVVGTNTNRIFEYIRNVNISNNLKIKVYDKIDESEFYHIINNQTDWLIPLLMPDLNNKTYTTERYSSNFNLSLALNKPIFCHQVFKNIYNLPGIYFSDFNIKHTLNTLIDTSSHQYYEYIKEFDYLKFVFERHNIGVLTNKLAD